MRAPCDLGLDTAEPPAAQNLCPFEVLFRGEGKPQRDTRIAHLKLVQSEYEAEVLLLIP
jgi:hypothetical protein